jgi:hypothetical protein
MTRFTSTNAQGAWLFRPVTWIVRRQTGDAR